MLSHIEKPYQPASTPWKLHIQSKTVVFVDDAHGVGHATAVLLAAHGAPVFLGARSAAALKQAFMDINKAGGECDGMVVDWDCQEGCHRFFMLAGAWLGGIDAVVTPLAEDVPDGQNLCMQEAVQRMQAAGRGHILHIDLFREDGQQYRAEQQMAAALRRQARQMGMRVTLIQPDSRALRKPGADLDRPGPQEIARCVLESLAQPFGAEVVLLPGKSQTAKAKLLNK